MPGKKNPDCPWWSARGPKPALEVGRIGALLHFSSALPADCCLDPQGRSQAASGSKKTGIGPSA